MDDAGGRGDVPVAPLARPGGGATPPGVDGCTAGRVDASAAPDGVVEHRSPELGGEEEARHPDGRATAQAPGPTVTDTGPAAGGGEVALDDPAAEAAVLSSTPGGGIEEEDDLSEVSSDDAGEEAPARPDGDGGAARSDRVRAPGAREKIPAAGLEAVLTKAPAVLGAGPGARPAASRFARALPRILALANQKGGVGKTTTTVNLGACLADLGYRVLVCDLDPQGNASTGLGLNPHNMETSMYDVILNDLPIEDCIEPSSVRNLFVAPASLDLAGAEIELVPAFSRELRLKRALDAVLDDYDFVLIDCPPSLGLLTVNGLSAAHEVVVPVQCEYYALEGLGQLLRNVDLVQRNLNPTLAVSAIICVMYDARTKLSDQVVQEVRDHFGDKVCRNVVPRTVRLSEAPSFGQPIIAFDPTSRGAIAYRELAKEISGGTPQRAR